MVSIVKDLFGHYALMHDMLLLIVLLTLPLLWSLWQGTDFKCLNGFAFTEAY